MAQLTESDEWSGIYQLEEDDPVLGGPLPAGTSNLQPTQLASRTKYLRLRGISPWDATLEYPQDAYVSDDGKTWHSLVANTNVQPGTDPTKWERWGYTADDQAGLSNANPVMNGAASPGTAAAASRADHVHPSDTSRAPLASPTFTGTPAAPTAAAATNTTQLATTAFVQAAIATLINSAPGALDTLDELAAALGDDANFAATMTTALAGKQAAHANLTSLAGTTAAIIAKLIELGGTATVSLAELNFLDGVTSAIQTQLNAKAALASPALTGIPTAPTAAAATNTTQVATTAFVKAAIAASYKDQQSISAVPVANTLVVGSAATTLDFRNPTITDGAAIEGVAVPALSGVIPQGATLGMTNGQSGRIVYLVAYNAGSPVLCFSNMAGNVDLDESTLISPTTISAGATSASVIYSLSPVAAGSPFKLLGYIDISEAVAGTYATGPTKVQGAGGAVLAGISAFGYGQTWQSQSRSNGTTYYNTGKPMAFATTQGNGGSAFTASQTVGGATLGAYYYTGSGGPGMMVIPRNASYSAGGGSLATWIEFRL
jgi:hypothetical protein